jgi:YesN/AraC family two-component response regulator
MDEETREIPIPKARIFLVEDERLVVEDIRERLIRHGYSVVGTASSGQDAIEAIKATPPDLVIMDVRIMGELNGIEVAIILQSYFDNALPVVFLTGFSEEAFGYLKVLPEYIYLNKPFHESILIEAIQNALSKRSLPLRESL